METSKTENYKQRGVITMTEKLVYDGWHKIALVEAEIKGQKVMREKLVIKDSVAALVIDENGRMGLVRQYRPTTGEYLWEVPAGVMDKPHLNQIDTIMEELQEECEIMESDVNYIVEKPIYNYFMMAGSSDAKMSIYKISVKEQKDKLVSDADVDEVRWFTKREIASMVESGVIQDSKTMLTTLYFLRDHKPKLT